ncbi:replication protein A 32 kDa subunit B-like [Iris pallida]|uniref:Replication protein A 32 kDa subunit B-like n=1 Tax=Iris pallida TaxID=29817 RepID=A0AAX6E663_IRIPA|nr:replication protein A 32 kDa subunit B-like [Iris pallida]KAJ6846363.1 replication protein A 32 kDa subunit B-like [Iris pallida]
MYGNQFDGGSSSLFSGGGFMPSQATQAHDYSSSSTKVRGAQGVLPLTVKQISEAYHSNDDKSNFAVDGIDASNVRLMGLVMSKAERITDVSFTLDDGTGRIDVNRWVNETSDTNEMAIIENGMYVTISGTLKGFQGKKHVVAFSVRPVRDFNSITLHFLECIYVHLDNTKPKVPVNLGLGTETPVRNEVKGYQTPVPNQVSPYAMTRSSESDILKLVQDIFQEPASLAGENGLHINEVVRRLGMPMEKIQQAIEYHVDVGNIYSTIDEFHFKSAMNG